MKKLVMLICALVSAGLTLGSGSGRVDAPHLQDLLDKGGAERRAFENLVNEVSVSLPPEIKTAGLERYSTNALAYAMNNGLAVTKGGRLWASWISGGDGKNSFTVAAWSDDRGDTWTDAKLVIDGHSGLITDRTNIIGTFWLDPGGKLHLFTDQTLLHFDGRAGVWEAVCENPDDAESKWSVPHRIADGHVLNKPIVLENGDWALSAYLNTPWKGDGSFPGAFPELDAERGATCYVSVDRGKTWEKRGTVCFPKTRDGVCEWQESQLATASDGSAMRVFARVIDGDRPRLMASESVDGGRHWTKPHRLRSMDHTNSRFQIMRLASGRLLFVKHGKPVQSSEPYRGRTQLTAYLSDDDGETWQGGLELDAGACSYPDCCQASDGTIFVSHDHGRRDREAVIMVHRFTEADILARKPVSSGSRLGIVAIRAMGTRHNRGMAGGHNGTRSIEK